MPPALINKLRLFMYRAIFPALRENVRGDVLDIGGRDFFPFVKRDGAIHFSSWTCLELARSAIDDSDPGYKLVVGDGERSPFPDNSFDTVVNMQVLEHTMHPLVMVAEIARVLKLGGKVIFLIPQTSALHEVPTHYYNFTRYWVEHALPEAGLTLETLTPLGGRWNTHASHMFYFFLESFRVKAYSGLEFKRNIFFYILWPFMAVYALFGIAFGLLFSIGDLTEDPNNLLVVARKQ